MLKYLIRLLFALLCSMSSSAADLRFAVDASTEMPWAQIQDDKLKNGIHRDLGQAIAVRMGLAPVFMVLPRQRLQRALENGDVDLACVLTPDWLPGPFDWTSGFIDDADVVLSLASAPAPRRVDDLAGIAVGTVHGFRYPVLEERLGAGFMRDDAPTATHNLRKLEYGRIQHAVTNERFFNYQQRQGPLKAQLHPPLVIASHRTGCAISRHSHVTPAQVAAAIEQLKRNGTVSRILENYR